MSKTKVKFVNLAGQPIALFPDEIADNNGNIMSYQKIGQHGAATPKLLRRKSIKAEELKKELERIGYELEVQD